MVAPRPRLVALALTAAIVQAAAPAVAPAPLEAASPREPAPRPPDEPRGIRAFMQALAWVESRGFYRVRNPRSGAIGRYQVLPSNWPAWAGRYVGDRSVRPTSLMQERVARGRITDLYAKYRRWDLVAYWWLTGRNGLRTRPWSDVATRYVDRVMDGYRVIRRVLASRPQRLSERNERLVYAGPWRIARHGSYAGGRAAYATRAGARVTLTFTGRAVSWIGPVGPTRGRVAIYLDGRYLRSISLRASRFAARRVLLEQAWPRAARHTLTIHVLSTPGRPVVALDELLVRR